MKNLNNKLVISGVFGYVFLTFMIISTIFGLISSYEYFENIIITISNVLNLSLASIFLALIAKQKFKPSQTSYLSLVIIGLKLVSIPVLAIVFSQYLLNSIANFICSLAFTRALLKNNRYFSITILVGIPSGIILALIAQLFVNQEQQIEYGDFLRESLVEIIYCIIQIMSVLFLIFYQRIENTIKINMARDFSNVIAYEIFTTLAVIETEIGVLRTHNLKRDSQDILQLLTRNCRKMRKRVNSIIQNIQLIGLIPNLVTSKISIRDIIKDCIGDYLEGGSSISLTDHNDIHVIASPSMLKSLFCNMLDNALQHGCVNPNIEIIISENYVIFQDNGGGVRTMDVDHIFNMFATSKDNHLGIGLTVSKEIMESYGGSIKCVSLEGQNTTFILKFPVCHFALSAEEI